jgi:hypothetical protein
MSTITAIAAHDQWLCGKDAVEVEYRKGKAIFDKNWFPVGN